MPQAKKTKAKTYLAPDRELVIDVLASMDVEALQKLMGVVAVRKREKAIKVVPVAAIEELQKLRDYCEQGTKVIYDLMLPIRVTTTVKADSNWEFGHVDEWKLDLLSTDETAEKFYKQYVKDNVELGIADDSGGLETVLPRVGDACKVETASQARFETALREFETTYGVDPWSILDK